MNAKEQKITESLLDEIAKKLSNTFIQIRLSSFGSYAYGEPKTDSDLDLLVIMDTDLRPTARSAAIARICRPNTLRWILLCAHLKKFKPICKTLIPFSRKYSNLDASSTNPPGDIQAWVYKAEEDFRTATTMVRKTQRTCSRQCVFLRAAVYRKVSQSLSGPSSHSFSKNSRSFGTVRFRCRY